MIKIYSILKTFLTTKKIYKSSDNALKMLIFSFPIKKEVIMKNQCICAVLDENLFLIPLPLVSKFHVFMKQLSPK